MTGKQKLALAAVTIGSGVVFLDGTVVNLALPALSKDLGSSFSDLQWIADGYLLSLSALIMLGGSLGDIFGRKRTYIIGLVGFAITSLLSGLAPTSMALITLRILQGVFGALLVPGALAVINTNFVAKERSKAFGLWTAWSAAITAIGPMVGGYLVDVGSWRWIFYINVPLIALCLWLGWVGIVESKDVKKRTIDFIGALLAIAALGGITYGLIEGPARQWNSTTTLPLAAGLFLLGVFLWWERRAKDPMLTLSLFRSRNFNAANIATFAMYGALGGFFFSLLIHLQTVVGFSSAKAGASLIPVTILLLLISGRAGALSHKYGPRRFMTVGPLLLALAIIFLGRLQAGSDLWAEVLPGVVIFGLGLSIVVAPLTTTVMASVDEAQSGIASAVNNAVSRVSGLMVIAILGLLGAAQSYKLATIVCASMAVIAAVSSWLLVEDHKLS